MQRQHDFGDVMYVTHACDSVRGTQSPYVPLLSSFTKDFQAIAAINIFPSHSIGQVADRQPTDPAWSIPCTVTCTKRFMLFLALYMTSRILFCKTSNAPTNE